VGRWRGEIRAGVRAHPQWHYVNLPESVMRTKLQALARRYDFTIDRIAYVRTLRGQFAPKIVVHTRHYLRMARATPLILKQIDPLNWRSGGRRTHARFEAFFFQANDEHGVPFLGAFNFYRAPGPGGGQWARSDALYPFGHL
jgi:hypothetical protein